MQITYAALSQHKAGIGLHVVSYNQIQYLAILIA